jgi:hypothetical protein
MDKMDKHTPDEQFVKVVLVQEYDDTDETDVECPWALDLGEGRYQLKNFPFYFYGLSYDDVFKAEPLYEDDPRPYFVEVISKSGHRTARVFLGQSIKESAEAKAALDHLSGMGCGYEGNGQRVFTVNIQPHCDYDAVLAFFDSCDMIEEWELADPVLEDTEPASGD